MSDLSPQDSLKSNSSGKGAALLLTLSLAGCALPRFQSEDSPSLEDGAVVRTINPDHRNSSLAILAPDIARPVHDKDQIAAFLARLAMPALEDLTTINATFSGLASVGIHLEPESGRAHGIAEVTGHGQYTLEGIYRVQTVEREDGQQDKILQIKLLKNLLAGVEVQFLQRSKAKLSDFDNASELQVSCSFNAYILAQIFGVRSLNTGGFIPVQREAGSPSQLSIVNAEYVDNLAKANPELVELPLRLKGLFERSKEISTELSFLNPDPGSSDYVLPRIVVEDLLKNQTGDRLFVDMKWGSQSRTVEILGLIGGRVYFKNHLYDSRYFEGDSPGRPEIVERGVESLSYSAFQECHPRNFRRLRSPDLFIGGAKERQVYIASMQKPAAMELAALEEFHSGIARFEKLCGLSPGAMTIFFGEGSDLRSYGTLHDSAVNGNSLLAQLRPVELFGPGRDLSELGFMRAIEAFDKSFDILSNSVVGLGQPRRQDLGKLLEAYGWPIADPSRDSWPASASAGVLYSLSRQGGLDLDRASITALSDYARALDDLKSEYLSSPLHNSQAPAELMQCINQRRQELSDIFAVRRPAQESLPERTPVEPAAVPKHTLKSLFRKEEPSFAAPVSEGLSAGQIEQLRPIFQDSIDYKRVKIEQGPDWMFAANGNRAFVTGNTVHLPADVSFNGDLLVHELTHVWQYQNGGVGYAFRALSAQMKSRQENGSDLQAYSYARDLIAGKVWAELNPEQQAEIVVAAHALLKNPDTALLVHANGQQRIVSKATPEGLIEPQYLQLVCHESYQDMTDFVLSALENIRKGRGARPEHSKDK